jgi:hypothetical protein
VNVINVIGCILLSALVGLIGSTILIFCFFNLIYIINSVSLIFSSSEQSSKRMCERNHYQKNINYRQDVIDSFLNIFLRYRTRNHTPSLIKESKKYHKYCNSPCDNQSINGIIPKVSDNPLDNNISIHADNVSPNMEGVNHEQTEPK